MKFETPFRFGSRYRLPTRHGPCSNKKSISQRMGSWLAVLFAGFCLARGSSRKIQYRSLEQNCGPGSAPGSKRCRTAAGWNGRARNIAFCQEERPKPPDSASDHRDNPVCKSRDSPQRRHGRCRSYCKEPQVRRIPSLPVHLPPVPWSQHRIRCASRDFYPRLPPAPHDLFGPFPNPLHATYPKPLPLFRPYR